MIQFGLASTPVVRWLIGSDKAIYKAVVDFYMGNADRDFVEVAGPPTEDDLARRKPGVSVPLPLVRLQMKLARNSLSGEPGIEVTCSEADQIEIARWCRQSQVKGQAA